METSKPVSRWDTLPDTEKKRLQDEYRLLVDSNDSGQWKTDYTPDQRYIIINYLETTYGKRNLAGIPSVKTWKELMVTGFLKSDIKVTSDSDKLETIAFSPLDISSAVVRKMVATAKIAVLIKEIYGGLVLPEHLISGVSYSIVCNSIDGKPTLSVVTSYDSMGLLSFHTFQQAEQFLLNNTKLVCDYYMIQDANTTTKSTD